ncbi:UNVERIFIED_ORG: hypothetical protein FNL38_11142 [Nocardia globerula]|uniref:Uncharacterized protein n=1 Tax=Nocardia globerula TaxID=1818 RepID=A0A652YHV7_NOCGL
MFGSLPRVPPQKCRFERPLAERRKTGTDLVEAAGHLFGAGGFVLRGVRSVSAGEVYFIGRFVVAQPFVAWVPECATDVLAVLDITDINRG